MQPAAEWLCCRGEHIEIVLRWSDCQVLLFNSGMISFKFNVTEILGTLKINPYVHTEGIVDPYKSVQVDLAEEMNSYKS